MTIEEDIDKLLRSNYTLKKDSNNVRVWISKKKIDYDALYEAVINIHKEIMKKDLDAELNDYRRRD